MFRKIVKIIEVTLFVTSVFSYAASFILFMLKYYYCVGFLAAYDLSELVVYLFATGVITALIFNLIMSITEDYLPSNTLTAEDRKKLRELIDQLD